MSSNVIECIVMADLHWGVIDPSVFEKELDKCLFEPLRHRKNKIDFLVIAGDTFDMREYFSSKTVRYVIRFLYQLLDYVDKIFVIEGTRNHDGYQTIPLSTIFCDVLKTNQIQFIQEVTDIRYKDISVLFIPEEYVVDEENYYKSFFSNHYDFIFGHGMIDKIWYARESNEKLVVNHVPSAPLFSVDQLCSVANYVYFGHVHTHKAYGPRNRFKYIGPPTRWEFDKDWDCGYYHVWYDRTTGLANEEFIVNELARKLNTTILTVDHELTSSEINLLSLSVRNQLPHCDRLRVILNMYDDVPNVITIRNTIIAKLETYSNVRIDVKMLSRADGPTDAQETIEERNQRINEYVQIPEDVRIQSFIKERTDRLISIDTIREVTGLDKLKRGDIANEETC